MPGSHWNSKGEPKNRYPTKEAVEAAILRRGGWLLSYECNTCNGFHYCRSGYVKPFSKFSLRWRRIRDFELLFNIELGSRASMQLYQENVPGLTAPFNVIRVRFSAAQRRTNANR